MTPMVCSCGRSMPPGPYAVHKKHCKGKATLEAFLEQGVVHEDNSGCWIWRGPTLPNGRPLFKWPGAGAVAARAALQLTGVEIPPRMQALHYCDIIECVNPEHLWVGTQSENLLDCSRKGRSGTSWNEASRKKRSGDDHWTKRLGTEKEHSKKMLNARWKKGGAQ